MGQLQAIRQFLVYLGGQAVVRLVAVHAAAAVAAVADGSGSVQVATATVIQAMSDDDWGQRSGKTGV